MNPDHYSRAELTGRGYLPRCICGWRATDFYKDRTEASDACEEHERRAGQGRLYSGARKPGLKTLLNQYRNNETSLVYSEKERAQWKMLADEIEDRIESETAVIPGQESLFD